MCLVCDVFMIILDVDISRSGNLKRTETGFYPALQLKVKTRARMSPAKTNNKQKQFYGIQAQLFQHMNLDHPGCCFGCL